MTEIMQVNIEFSDKNVIIQSNIKINDPLDQGVVSILNQIEIAQLSVVIPVFNEEGNVALLAKEVETALSGKLDYEIIFVDDASLDATLLILKDLCSTISNLRVVQHKKNAGQSAAIVTGVKAAKFPWIVTLDGDRQNNPDDIMNLVKAINKYPSPTSAILCTGFRTKRHDQFIRKASSKIANRVRSFFLKDNCPDTGCGIKIFSRALFMSIPHFKNCHRFLPALCKRAGAIIINVPVSHRQRTAGKSKYGINNRLWVGIIDMIGVAWLLRRPTQVEYDDVSST